MRRFTPSCLNCEEEIARRCPSLAAVFRTREIQKERVLEVNRAFSACAWNGINPGALPQAGAECRAFGAKHILRHALRLCVGQALPGKHSPELPRCKECRVSPTNGTNEPNRCCRHRLLFSWNSDPSGSACKKGAYT